MTEIFIGEREKWTNKGNDKQQETDSLLHNTTSHTQHLNFKILGAVVPEKSLMKKKFTPPPPPHTHTITEKTKTITSLYTSYAEGIISVRPAKTQISLGIRPV